MFSLISSRDKQACLVVLRNSRLLSFSHRNSRSWNPFNRPTIHTPPTGIESSSELVINATQELRSDVSPQRLSRLLVELALDDTEAEADTKQVKGQTFTLMNEIFRKLNQQPAQLLSPKDKYLIFSSVISHIDTSNYSSARFVPRLYLELIDGASLNKDKKLLLDSFADFVRYLSVLGYSTQLSQVIESFVKKDPTLLQDSFKLTKDTLSSIEKVHPSVYIKVYDVFEWLGLNKHALKSLLNLTLRSTLDHFRNRDSIFSIDTEELSLVNNFLEKALTHNTKPKKLLKVIDICQYSSSSKTIETAATKKLVAKLSTLKDLSGFSFDNLQSFVKIIISNDHDLPAHELKTIISLLEDSLIESFESDKKPFDLKVQLVTFGNGFTDDLKELISLHSDKVDHETLDSILFALSYREQNLFDTQFSDLVSFFESKFPEVEKSIEFFTILIDQAARNSDYQKLRSYFNDSSQNGIDWKENKKQLFKFLTKLAEEPNADIPDVFQWYKRVKFFVDYLDAESYNAMMKLFLKNDAEDAISSMKHELPPLEDGKKFQEENYPDLFHTVTSWMIHESVNPDDVWDLYAALDKYFDLPYDIYLPIMKRLNDMNRPDYAFHVFQQLKKRHRTTGSVPPPTSEMYCYLFKNFGNKVYAEGVSTLYMILNLDLHINSDINVMNAAMDAYSNLMDVQQVLDIFDKVITIPGHKGLNNETVSIMLKSLTFVSLDQVKNFWNNLDTINILPDSKNFNQFILAHCYHDEYDTALKIASTMEDFDVKMTPQIIENLFTWTANEEKRELVKQWAIENHQPLWKSIESKLRSVPVLKTEDRDPDDISLSLIKASIENCS